MTPKSVLSTCLACGLKPCSWTTEEGGPIASAKEFLCDLCYAVYEDPTVPASHSTKTKIAVALSKKDWHLGPRFSVYIGEIQKEEVIVYKHRLQMQCKASQIEAAKEALDGGVDYLFEPRE